MQPMPSVNYNRSKHSFLHNFVFENFSYKIVSLFIAFVLWISILGRRDFVSTQEIELNFTTAQGYALLSQSTDRVKIKISGSQSLMKKFRDQAHIITFDVTDKIEGSYEVDITSGHVELPDGLRVLNIRPNFVKFEIIKK